jgi:hypothetical protein
LRHGGGRHEGDGQGQVPHGTVRNAGG